jgi:hypothetical protein
MMSDEGDKRDDAPREKDAKQARLKFALRDNLRRRKSQARERGKMEAAPSNLHEDTLDDDTRRGDG